jgi:BlaI family penicillinase repressor
MVDKHDRYYLTPAEKLVMRIIWLSDRELVLNEILRACNEQYGKNWKSQTVSTYLSHLVQKEYLCMERNGKYCQYKPIVTVKEYLRYDAGNFSDYWGVDKDLFRAFVKNVAESADSEGNNLVNKI